jgi:ABC-type branched-subunit amino acid transport system permease subunit
MAEGDEPSEDGGGGLTVIAHVYSQPEAAVLTATLAAYGFETIAGSRGAISVMPDLMVALGGIPIAVRSEDAADAVALLEEIDTGWTAPPPPFDPNEAVNGATSVASAALGGVPMPRIRGDYAWRPKIGRDPSEP